MGLFTQLFRKERSLFLSTLSQHERVAVGNLNPMLYEAVISEKQGKPMATIIVDDDTTLTILRRLCIEEIQTLERSVQCSLKADRSPSPSEQAKLYHEAATVNPFNDLALMSYGCAIANQGNLREGIRWVEKALKVNPENERARRNLQGMRASL